MLVLFINMSEQRKKGDFNGIRAMYIQESDVLWVIYSQYYPKNLCNEGKKTASFRRCDREQWNVNWHTWNWSWRRITAAKACSARSLLCIRRLSKMYFWRQTVHCAKRHCDTANVIHSFKVLNLKNFLTSGMEWALTGDEEMLNCDLELVGS